MGIFYCTNFFSKTSILGVRGRRSFEKGSLAHFGGSFFPISANWVGRIKKCLSAISKELKKIGEVCFGVLSIALIASEKIGFL